jgi:hypothetical protein
MSTPAHKNALEAFKERLIAEGVSALEIAWGDYVEHFHEVPEHLRERYLHHRGRLLHRDALALSLLEQTAMENHPFAQ